MLQIPWDENAASASIPFNCSDIKASELGSVDCVSYSWGRVLDVDNHGICIPHPYTSSLCRQQLLAWQECAVGGAEDPLLDLNVGKLSLEEREKDISQFLHFLRKFSPAYTALIPKIL